MSTKLFISLAKELSDVYMSILFEFVSFFMMSDWQDANFFYLGLLILVNK